MSIMGSLGVSSANLQDSSKVEEAQHQHQRLGLIQPKTVGAIINNNSGNNQEQNIPKLFTPLKIRGLTLHNRVLVSPMCMYSCADHDGVFTDFHLVHLGNLALHGPGLVMTEATSVTPNGRLSPKDTGLWNCTQMESLRRIVNFVHGSSGKIGVQLAHGGRKASTYPPFHNFEESGGQLGRGSVPKEDDGFPEQLVAPSPIPWKDGFPTPNEMTQGQIKEMVTAWAEAAKRAVEAGVDLIEIHAAHGYLIHEFLSGNTNQRTDEYGGTPANRQRFLVEIVTGIRAVIPSTMPLFLRVSGTDYAHDADPLASDPNGWDIYQVVELCKVLVPLGVDVIDISSGANISTAQKTLFGDAFGFQLPLAEVVKKAQIPGLLVASVGAMHNASFAEAALQEGKADMVFVARQFLKDPNLIQTMADELGLNNVRWALQYSWMWFNKVKPIVKA